MVFTMFRTQPFTTVWLSKVSASTFFVTSSEIKSRAVLLLTCISLRCPLVPPYLRRGRTSYFPRIHSPLRLAESSRVHLQSRVADLLSQSDLKLVTSNAKTFNPTGSIYQTEADRIESYALDQITKAAGTVIEYETDWNIDVEKDDEPLAVDEEDVTGTMANRVAGTPIDVDESRAGSPSAQAGGAKKTRGKKPPGTLSESLEADGGLPGAKDGLGAFPAGSDWAGLMLALKLKGKRDVEVMLTS